MSFEACSTMKRPGMLGGRPRQQANCCFFPLRRGGIRVIAESDDNDNKGVFLTS